VKVLITGGCGFIGSEVVRVAIERGHEVVNLDKLTYAGNPANVAEFMTDPRYAFIHGDIADPELASQAVDGCEVVVNLAAESHVDRSLHNPTEFIETDVVGTATLITAAREAGVRRFVQVSTDEVYGSIPSGAFRETDPIQPSSPYSASKAGSDHLVRAYHHTYGLNVTTCNCSNNYGPYHFPEKLIPLCLTRILDSGPLPVYGDGSNIRDWLYVEDHARGIARILESGTVGEVYNIGGHNEWANLDIVRLLCQMMDERFAADEALAIRFPKAPQARGESAASLIEFVKDRAGHDWRYAIDATKIELDLGFTPQETFETGLAKTIDWYLNNEAWWRSLLQ